MRNPRRAYRWRILCHSPSRSGGTWSAGNHRTETENLTGEPRPHHTSAEPDQTEFDELVVGHWLHIEEQDDCMWWMDVGGVVLWITVKGDGQPRSVTVYAPGDYNMPVEGCEYGGAVADK